MVNPDFKIVVNYPIAWGRPGCKSKFTTSADSFRAWVECSNQAVECYKAKEPISEQKLATNYIDCGCKVESRFQNKHKLFN